MKRSTPGLRPGGYCGGGPLALAQPVWQPSRPMTPVRRPYT